MESTLSALAKTLAENVNKADKKIISINFFVEISPFFINFRNCAFSWLRY